MNSDEQRSTARDRSPGGSLFILVPVQILASPGTPRSCRPVRLFSVVPVLSVAPWLRGEILSFQQFPVV